MPRLIFLNRYFHPDHSATSQILSDIAFHLANAGHDVHVITSRQIYDAPHTVLSSEESVRGVSIHRVRTTAFGRRGLAGRSLDYLSFYTTMAVRLARLARPGDIVVAKTDPPLLSVPVAALARLYKFRLLNWLQDIYPEVAIELQVRLLRGSLGRRITALRNWSLRQADANIVLGDAMAARVAGTGAPPARIRSIPNWIDDKRVVPCATDENPLRMDWGLMDKFVVGYSGNLGRAHEYDTVLGAAQRLRHRSDVVFLMTGGGNQFERLAQAVKHKGLEGMFKFLPYQHRDRLSLSLSAADVHWISLRTELDGLIFPSKFYGIAAAGRPIIAITGRATDIANLVERNGCGFVIEPGDSAGMATLVERLATNSAECGEKGARARAMLERDFSRQHALARWKTLFEELTEQELRQPAEVRNRGASAL